MSDLRLLEVDYSTAPADGDLLTYDSTTGLWLPTEGRSASWSPNLVGFSVAPTAAVYRYTKVGKLCTLAVRQGGVGTSNANTFTISLPFTAATIANMAWSVRTVGTFDNGALIYTGLAYILSAGTVVTLVVDDAGTAWTAANGKKADFILSYETV